MPQHFAEQTVFGLETDQTRREQPTPGERRAVQLAVSQDVALRPRITRDKFVFQFQVADQRPYRFWKSRTLRTSFK